ncbi:MAG: nuclear transport factor 2 family protein, partial [Bdellovibrionales bacterium]|nr:nuclear transport factor 2 family protein [Bdellovibrionales bacterium]
MKLLSCFLVIGFLASGCASTKLSQRTDVQDTVIAMVNAIDTKKWSDATQFFDEKVFVDYESLNGQKGSMVPAKNLVGGWEKVLTKVRTQHMLTNFVVDINGETAETFSHVYASHLAKGYPYWDVYGRYHHKLKKNFNRDNIDIRDIRVINSK